MLQETLWPDNALLIHINFCLFTYIHVCLHIPAFKVLLVNISVTSYKGHQNLIGHLRELVLAVCLLSEAYSPDPGWLPYEANLFSVRLLLDFL